MAHRSRPVFIAACLVFSGCSSLGIHGAHQVDNPWAKLLSPTQGEPHAIGTASGGCVSGAISLDPGGPGYRVMRITRRRFYGHPLLVHYIEDLGKAVDAHHLPPLLVGDLGQPRGGPTPSGHLSHQRGLDADIWLSRAEHSELTLDDRERISARSMLIKDGSALDPANWDDGRAWILKTAVSFDGVDRIFVNPVIKRELCRRTPEAPWLAKVRPWWGHDDHFHVRMKCPAIDADHCKATDPIPPGNGCDKSLDWWFTDEAKKGGEDNAKKYRVQELPALPSECKEILDAPEI